MSESNVSVSVNASGSQLAADVAKVEEVLALIEKYDALLPIPAVAKTAIADLAALLRFFVKG